MNLKEIIEEDFDVISFSLWLIVTLLIVVFSLSCIGIVSATYTIDVNATENSLNYQFNPELNENISVFFDNKEIMYPVKSELFMSDLKSETGYTLVLNNPETGFYQHNISYTAEETGEFYTEFGIIGLFILICFILYLSVKIPYISYVAITLSGAGFIYIVKSGVNQFTAIIFALLIITSILITGKKED